MMNRHGAADISWAGGEHTFRLGLGEIEELEAATDMSIFLMLAAMSAQLPFARLKHYSETIRLGLIGGGMAPMEAKVLTRKHVNERPLAESVVLAQAVLTAAVQRVHSKEVDPPGEPEAPKSDVSISVPSTPTQP